MNTAKLNVSKASALVSVSVGREDNGPTPLQGGIFNFMFISQFNSIVASEARRITGIAQWKFKFSLIPWIPDSNFPQRGMVGLTPMPISFVYIGIGIIFQIQPNCFSDMVQAYVFIKKNKKNSQKRSDSQQNQHVSISIIIMNERLTLQSL